MGQATAATQTINARFPWALFVPLGSLTAGIGVLLLLAGRSVGWAAVAAPFVGLLAMRGPIRPRFELTADGVIFRRGARSPMLPWDEVAEFDLVKAGGRAVLAYRLRPEITVLKRHPGAGFLRAKGLDYDGGYFVDQMTAEPEEILKRFRSHLAASAR